MGLIALPPDYLRLNQRIPFGVYDAHGRLLVAAGHCIGDERKLSALQRRELFVDDNEAGPLRDSLHQTASALIRNNATLEVIAAARLATGSSSRTTRVAPSAPMRSDARDSSGAMSPAPSQASPPSIHTAETAGPKLPTFGRDGTLTQRCDALTKALGAALRDADADPFWLQRVQAVHEGLNDYTTYHRNAALYLLIQHAAHSNEQYSSHHAMLCAVICESVSRTLGWQPIARQRIGRAALTMNVAMTQLQDTLAMRDDPLRPIHKQQLSSHAQRSADLLAQAGVEDEVWLNIVRQHHDAALAAAPLAGLDPTQRMTRLLMSVDRFSARISRRGSRSPQSPLIAARDLCVGEDGLPDEFGAAILRMVGMYPPGSYVRLVNGELAVVLTPGRRMNQPQVAVIQGSSGLALSNPILRDTALPGREVVEAVPVAQVRVSVDPDRALSLT